MREGGPAAAEMMYGVVRAIEEELNDRVVPTLNLTVDTIGSGYVYFALPDPETGVYADDSFRIGVDSNGYLLVQKKVDGTWTKYARLA